MDLMEVICKKKQLICLISLPILVVVMIISQRFWNYSSSSFDFSGVWTSVSQHRSSEKFHEDKLLNGLLSQDFNEETCLSRYHINSYRKSSPYKPSSHLISKLRSYENLHKQCGPHSSSYKQALQILNKTQKFNSKCKYLVIRTRDGLGNKMISLVSAFLYALITDRVLLVDQNNGLDDLFCQPFPQSSWNLPVDFPIRSEFVSYNQWFPFSFGNLLRNGKLKSMEDDGKSSHLYLHLSHDATDYDKLFYCDKHQAFLKNLPWLIMETNNYIIPGIFLIQSFEKKLNDLFPDKNTVFHHLGRYLFHPTNDIWGLISRSYEPYLSRANEILGIQIRVFGSESGSFEDQMTQLKSCTQTKKLLPEISSDRSKTSRNSHKVKGVLVTSLNSQYQEGLKNMYWENPSVNGDLIAVYQPSHEGIQNSGKTTHNKKALAEILLLSLSDALVTSAWSTFGYVAQGLGGLKPWILYKAEDKVYEPLHSWLRYRTRNQTAEDWPCQAALSMEPCFHTPPVCDCLGMRRFDAGDVSPFVKHCEDASWGIKLVDQSNY